LAEGKPTTGVPELDRLLGGVLLGDNVVWEVDSGAPVDSFVSSFVSACEGEALPVIYVSFNRSPQTILKNYVGLVSPARFTLVDCFSMGKGNGDEVFVDYVRSLGEGEGPTVAMVEEPADPARLQEELSHSAKDTDARYVFDSLTGMLELWADEDVALRFFGHLCPRLYDLGTVAYWLLEREAHSQGFLAKVRHVTQVVVELAVSRGAWTLTVRKASKRHCAEIGVPRGFGLDDGRVAIAAESREDRELRLLTALGETLGSALDPSSFFERTMGVLAAELGMIRGTLVLLDRTRNRLRIAAAHGLTPAERARGEYAVGEGVTGRVVETGRPEVVSDIGEDPRFLDRTASRRAAYECPIAFICVPLRVDGEVVGALSVDRPFAVQATLEKDLRLLTIVASTVSQVLKINRLVRVEKEEILARDRGLLEELRSRYRLDRVAGESGAIQRVLATAAAAAKSRASVLITGETGTGKELVANVVHYNSDRAEGPLVKVNCGALPETLLESELFGHVRGAFTGAVRDRKGRFEVADGGTLFLDEVGEMSPRLQVKLLRVLQEMQFEPVGGQRTVRVDVRVVAATNTDLKKRMREGTFREDLYYRLNVIPVHLPPLRERREDIPVLVDHFLGIYSERNRKKVTKLSREVLDLLVGYDWPGNVRELENTVERAVVLAPGEVISRDLLPAEIVEGSGARRAAGPAGTEEELHDLVAEACDASTELGAVLKRLGGIVEEAVLRKGLERGLSQRDLAEALGMSRMTLRKKLREHGLSK
jgi:Nif-specific regulatory protein